MSRARYDKILLSGRSGIFAAPALAGPLRHAARCTGIEWRDLDLAGVRDREAFFGRVERTLDLPDYFGRNWDAFRECLLDLAATGTPGLVAHWRRGAELARRDPDTVRTALEILQETATWWGSSGRVFILAVERGSARGIDLPPLR